MDEPSTFFTIFTLAISCLFSASCYYTAKKKNRNEKIWAILGLFFHLFAFMLLLLLPKKQKIIKKPVSESPISNTSIHNEAAALNDDEAFEPPRKPRISGSKSMVWYYIDQNKDNSIKGPYLINELRIELHKYNLDSSTYIWCEEFEEWTMISEFSNCSLLLDADFIE